MSLLPCCRPQIPPDPSKVRNDQISEDLERERKIYRVTHRLLLLGAGESGKSTIVKQMQIINLKGYTPEERKDFIPNIYNNVRDVMVSILGAMKSVSPTITFADEHNVVVATEILDNYSTGNKYEYSQQFFDDCEMLWQTRAVQDCYERSNEYHLIDSAKYFLDRISELKQEDYLPNEQDILRCRVLTTQILEIKFRVKDAIFHMFDVGGQRDQRRKWIQCFNDATAIVFVTALSGYNLFLREDETKNRLQESLDLFLQIWENRFLREVSIILFLNKQDLFLEKITANRFKLGDYFPAYPFYQPTLTKKDTQNEAAEFVRAKFFLRDSFLSLTKQSDVPHSSRLCFPHFTCAVDTDHMRKIFEDCRIVIQRIHLERFGILAMDS